MLVVVAFTRSQYCVVICSPVPFVDWNAWNCQRFLHTPYSQMLTDASDASDAHLYTSYLKSNLPKKCYSLQRRLHLSLLRLIFENKTQPPLHRISSLCQSFKLIQLMNKATLPGNHDIQLTTRHIPCPGVFYLRMLIAAKYDVLPHFWILCLVLHATMFYMTVSWMKWFQPDENGQKLSVLDPGFWNPSRILDTFLKIWAR